MQVNAAIFRTYRRRPSYVGQKVATNFSKNVEIFTKSPQFAITAGERGVDAHPYRLHASAFCQDAYKFALWRYQHAQESLERCANLPPRSKDALQANDEAYADANHAPQSPNRTLAPYCAQIGV